MPILSITECEVPNPGPRYQLLLSHIAPYGGKYG